MRRSEGVCMKGGGEGLLGGGKLRGFVRVHATGLGGRGWFKEGISRGRGIYFFWTDPWLGGISLRKRFMRLFDLAESKSKTVAEMYDIGWGGGGEAWV
jgi:hypothetical protein